MPDSEQVRVGDLMQAHRGCCSVDAESARQAPHLESSQNIDCQGQLDWRGCKCHLDQASNLPGPVRVGADRAERWEKGHDHELHLVGDGEGPRPVHSVTGMRMLGNPPHVPGRVPVAGV
jgi:hypothetical protein